MERLELITDIVEIELEMFLDVNGREPAACQQNPEGFKFFRTAMYSVWSEKTLKSYLQDLQDAKSKGENLVTLKYARMEGLIPELKSNDNIDKIVELQVSWVKELVERYPYLHRRARPVEDDQSGVTSTRTYLRGELETYSEQTLEYYYSDLLRCRQNGENPMEERCLAMLSGSGYTSLEEAEAAEAARAKSDG